MKTLIAWAGAGALLLAACSVQSEAERPVAGEGRPEASPAPVAPVPQAPRPSPAPKRDLVSEAPFTADSAQGAANFVQTYYALIEARKFGEAHKLWGPASDLADGTFADRFTGYREYHAEVGAPGEIEGAAGSLYVEVPVRTYGVTMRGERFEVPGIVTLRRVNNVDGATAEQRRWHIAQIELPPH